MAKQQYTPDPLETEYTYELLKHKHLWWTRWLFYVYTAALLVTTPVYLFTGVNPGYEVYAVIFKSGAVALCITCVVLSISLHSHVEFTPLRQWLEKQIEAEQPKQTIEPWPTRFKIAGRYPHIECVYLIRDLDVTGYTKIGRTNDLHSRLRHFGAKLPFRFQIVHIIKTDTSHAIERQLHLQFASKRVNRSEWFTLDAADVAWIKAISNNAP